MPETTELKATEPEATKPEAAKPEATELRGAEIVLQCLRAEGVDLVFGYPGGAIMPLYDALDGSGVRHILTRHEQGAVFAAEGYTRATGKVGVAMATSGPGATNLVTGMADAKIGTRSLVCGTGRVRSASWARWLLGPMIFAFLFRSPSRAAPYRFLEEISAVIAEAFHWRRRAAPGHGGYSHRPDESAHGVFRPGGSSRRGQAGG